MFIYFDWGIFFSSFQLLADFLCGWKCNREQSSSTECRSEEIIFQVWDRTRTLIVIMKRKLHCSAIPEISALMLANRETCWQKPSPTWYKFTEGWVIFGEFPNTLLRHIVTCQMHTLFLLYLSMVSNAADNCTGIN